MTLDYRSDLVGVDWDQVKADLIADDFHNGRTSRQLALSFENSQHVVMVWDAGTSDNMHLVSHIPPMSSVHNLFVAGVPLLLL